MPKSFVTKLASDPDPIPVWKFWVEVDSNVTIEFKECTGLSMQREVQEVPEGGVNDHVHILPGRTKQSRIVLKYGLDVNNYLWNWYQAGLYDGKVTRTDFIIYLYGVDGTVKKKWKVWGGFPVKWEGPGLNVETNQAAIETLEIAHHGITMLT